MDIPSQSQSSTTATYRLPLWWPPEMVVVPTVPEESRDQMIRRAAKWLRNPDTPPVSGIPDM